MYEQTNLFNIDDYPEESTCRLLEMPDADVIFYDQFFSTADGDRLFAALDRSTQWRQDQIKVFGKTMPLPRLTAWHGNSDKCYTYSGIEMCPEPWTDTLLEIKAQVEDCAGVKFNSVLLNKYRTGQDSVAWHSDDEAELGKDPVIASVSFGATRRFAFKHKYDKHLDRISIDLTHGSLVLMRGPTQHFWQHQVPKTAKTISARINLTFRSIT